MLSCTVGRGKFESSPCETHNFLTTQLHDLHLNAKPCYRIQAMRVLSPCWLDMLSGDWVIVEWTAGRLDTTTLVGQVGDQAALKGVLNRT